MAQTSVTLNVSPVDVNDTPVEKNQLAKYLHLNSHDLLQFTSFKYLAI